MDYDRVKNRRAAMEMAEEAAMKGCPIAGALFGFLHSVRGDPIADFEEEFWFYENDEEDDSYDIRPY